MKKRKRNLLKPLLLIAMGTVLAIGMMELYISTFGKDFLSPSPRIVVNDRLAKMEPFSDFTTHEETKNFIKINNFGFHHVDWKKKSDKYRILFIGDSFVEGVHVPIKDLFTSRVEKRFQQAGHQVEVLNAGIEGTGTAYQYLLCKKYFREKIDIDHIVLFILLGNDLENNSPTINPPVDNYAVTLNENGNIRMHKYEYGILQSAVRELSRYFATASLAYRGLYNLKRKWRRWSIQDQIDLENDLEEPSSGGNSSSWKAVISGTIRLIEKWRKEARRDSVNFSIAVIPEARFFVTPGGDLLGGEKNSVRDHQRDIFLSKLLKFTREKDVPLLFLDFRKYDPYDIYSFDGKIMGHFNHFRHKIAFEHVFGWLSDHVSPTNRIGT